MLINKLKTCKAIDMESKLKEYVIKNYDNESLTEKVKTYFGEVTQGVKWANITMILVN